MILDIEDYFSKGCGRCNRFATKFWRARELWSDELKDPNENAQARVGSRLPLPKRPSDALKEIPIANVLMQSADRFRCFGSLVGYFLFDFAPG
jgi:hypothetical protein